MCHLVFERSAVHSYPRQFFCVIIEKYETAFETASFG